MEIDKELQSKFNPADLSKLISSAKFSHDGTPLVFSKLCLIDEEREGRYKNHLELSGDLCLIGAIDLDGIQHIIAFKPSLTEPELITTQCGISYETISVTQLVEFCYSPNKWKMSKSSEDSLCYYKATKFDYWRKLLLEPSCEAQFRRTLKQGVVSRLFDKMVFPMDENEVENWQVRDERGKIVDIPRPIHSLRIWKGEKYESIDPKMDNAPTDEEAPKWWDDFLGKLKEKHGEEYISKMIGGN